MCYSVNHTMKLYQYVCNTDELVDRNMVFHFDATETVATVKSVSVSAATATEVLHKKKIEW